MNLDDMIRTHADLAERATDLRRGL